MKHSSPISHEIYQNRLLKFPTAPSKISKRFNPFNKMYEKISDRPTIRYSIEEIPQSLIHYHNKNCHSQGSLPQENSQILEPITKKPNQGFWYQNKTIKASRAEDFQNRRDLLKTESKPKNSKRWLNSPYQIQSSNDSLGISSRKMKGKTMNGFGFSESSPFPFGARQIQEKFRKKEGMETPTIDEVQIFDNRVFFNGDWYKRYPKGSSSLKNYLIINFGGIVLKIIQFITMIILLKLFFDFFNKSKQIKEKEYFYFSSNSIKYLSELFIKTLKQFSNISNFMLTFILCGFSIIHRYLFSQKELVEEAYIVYYDLEEKLFHEKIIDKTFFDEEFFKMDFFNRKKIYQIRKFLYQLIHTDPRIAFMRNRTNLQLFVFKN